MAVQKQREKKLKDFIRENQYEIDMDIRSGFSPFTKITKRDREDYVYASDLWVLRAQKEGVRI